MKKIPLLQKVCLAVAPLFFLVVSCGPEQPEGTRSDLREAIDARNNPDNMPGANGPLDAVFDHLPTSGTVAVPVWTGYWWPYSAGGTARRFRSWEPSALEKYDMVAGNNEATNWEMTQVQIYGSVPWAGHCNGLSAAGTMMTQPRQPVTYRGVYFNVDDVKALLVEMWQGGGWIIGGRCDNQNITFDGYGRLADSFCRDLNPGSFHIALGNFIGRLGKAIIVDTVATSEVWNHPIVSYQIKAMQDLTAAEANRWLGARAPLYVFNPAAVSFKYIHVVVTYETGTRIEYQYILELNAARAIIGGEWVGGSKTSHPDFMWRHSIPKPDNPYLSVSLVFDIYKLSL